MASFISCLCKMDERNYGASGSSYGAGKSERKRQRGNLRNRAVVQSRSALSVISVENGKKTEFPDEYSQYGEFTGTMAGIICTDSMLHQKYADFNFFEYIADETKPVG